MKSLTPDLDPYKDGLKIYTTVDSRMQSMPKKPCANKCAMCRRTSNRTGEAWILGE